MRKPRLRRHRAAVRAERTLDVLVPEVPAVEVTGISPVSAHIIEQMVAQAHGLLRNTSRWI